MAKLSIEQAPTPSTPRRFLLTASAWGGVAGVLLIVDGATALASRWGGATLAIVHALTLGFLGNAMFGSLQQFLPVAAGVRVRGGHAGAAWLHALLNVGTLMLVVSFRWPQAWPAWWGGALLLVAFSLLAWGTLPAIVRAAGQRLLLWGLGGAIVAGAMTALLGACLTLGVSGVLVLPLMPLTDAHAAWGVLGWVVALMASVSRLVGPMFQGLQVPRERSQAMWHAALLVVLLAGAWAAIQGAVGEWFRVGVALTALVFAATGLVLQVRAPKLRKAPLTGFWALGLLALLASAGLLLGGGAHGVLVGALAIGIGLPLLVVGMQLEIVAFLAWIGLHRHCGKGVRLPGVHVLLPERDKYAVLALHVMAGGTLLIAIVSPATAWPRVAGAAMLLAHGAAFTAQLAAGRRGRQFVQQLRSRP